MCIFFNNVPNYVEEKETMATSVFSSVVILHCTPKDFEHIVKISYTNVV